jgi:hypothetical protein
MIAYDVRHAAHWDAEAVLALARDFATSFVVDPTAFGASLSTLVADSHACLLVAEQGGQSVRVARQWLGTFSGAGNGDYGTELEAACRVIVAYLQAKGLVPTQGLLRLDALYSNASPLAHIQHAGLGFLTRGRDYQLLDHPKVRSREPGWDRRDVLWVGADVDRSH